MFKVGRSYMLCVYILHTQADAEVGLFFEQSLLQYSFEN